MKTIFKTSYIILGGALMFSSCAQEDTPEVRHDGSDRRIVFHTSLPGLTTRAKEIVTDLTSFHLTVFDETHSEVEEEKLKEYIDNLLVVKTEGSFVSDDCLWPEEPGQESYLLHFFAYYPSLDYEAMPVNATSVGRSTKTIGYKINGFQVAPDIPDQVDFVTAYATGSMADNLFSGIQLNFEHRLSRIEVKAWGANKSCDIEIAGVRIGGVNVKGDFDFNPPEGESVWSAPEKGFVEHIFKDEELVILSEKNNSHATSETAVSIMGANIGDENNCAMLIPTADETGWKYGTDIHNEDQGMYISVLLRVVDKTPGGNDKQQYPYFDNSQGLNAMNIDRVYLAVDKTKRTVSKRVYKEGNGYFTDEDCTQSYTIADGEEIREFGWAALPVTGIWEAGYTYSYTLDYTSGVGLHDPSVKDPQEVSDSPYPGPFAGDPIISDRVSVTVSVNSWQGLNGTTTYKIEVPGS